ncbi:hypothetical protein AA15669_1808 [Saccharibacter floricola DSM 15669]|uniref:Uncharacterized protein n=1 Tax=Saccharibacter floricola DSM 15669 TaxID=1123227 RepID=A0ABQ0P173_9PROT|nr:hypothetical protein AA15669_1808 [Saccharibacter floricola DSM 15669]
MQLGAINPASLQDGYRIAIITEGKEEVLQSDVFMLVLSSENECTLKRLFKCGGQHRALPIVSKGQTDENKETNM